MPTESGVPVGAQHAAPRPEHAPALLLIPDLEAVEASDRDRVANFLCHAGDMVGQLELF